MKLKYIVFFFSLFFILCLAGYSINHLIGLNQEIEEKRYNMVCVSNYTSNFQKCYDSRELNQTQIFSLYLKNDQVNVGWKD